MTMQYTRLGRTGLRVSRLCLGTMTFAKQCDQAASFAILDRAAELGIDFIDTADAYPLGGNLNERGRTETLLGAWLKGQRDQFVLATKCNQRMGERAWNAGNSRKHIMEAIDASLTRLGTDYVDLYQLHFPDPETPIDETLRALDDLCRSGKVRYIGCSNFPAWRLARAIGRSEVLGLARFDCIQPRYNLLFREFERDLFPLCAEEGVGVIPYNPLAGGLLTGKHLGASDPGAGTRFTLGTAGRMYRERYWHEREHATVAEIKALAEEAGVGMVALVLAWVLANPVVTAPIVGATRAAQLDDSAAALDLPLDAELKARLDDLTAEYRRGDAAR